MSQCVLVWYATGVTPEDLVRVSTVMPGTDTDKKTHFSHRTALLLVLACAIASVLLIANNLLQTHESAIGPFPLLIRYHNDAVVTVKYYGQ